MALYHEDFIDFQNTFRELGIAGTHKEALTFAYGFAGDLPMPINLMIASKDNLDKVLKMMDKIDNQKGFASLQAPFDQLTTGLEDYDGLIEILYGTKMPYAVGESFETAVANAKAYPLLLIVRMAELVSVWKR